MKQLICAMVALIMVLVPCALAEQEQEILLYTAYTDAQQDVLQLGWVDSDGDVYFWSGSRTEADWSADADTLLAWMLACTDAEVTGSVTDDDLWDLKGLVACVSKVDDPEWQSAACDAGSETSCAVRDGEVILLGGSGDDMWENTDPTAQALYLRLRELCPGVQSYFGEDIGPAGFQSVPITEFCGYADVDFTISGWTRTEYDCEAGPGDPIAINGAPEFFGGNVIGKANCNSVTGNTVIYNYCDADGESIAAFEFYDGLLVATDGMYYVEY